VLHIAASILCVTQMHTTYCAVNCQLIVVLVSAAWMIIGLIGSFLFILIQLILIIDFSHMWNGAWLDRHDDSQNKCWLIGKQLSLSLYDVITDWSSEPPVFLKYCWFWSNDKI